MLKLNRKIAIVMAFVFCMSFLAPAFIAPSVAEAAFTALYPRAIMYLLQTVKT